MAQAGTITATDANVMGSLTQKLTQLMTAPDNTGSGATPLGGKSFIAFSSPGVAIAQGDLIFGDMTTKPQINANSAFSQVVNNIPNSAGFWGLTGKKVWDIYQEAITNVQLPIVALTPAQESQLKKAQDFLVQSVTKTDPFTGAQKTVVQDSVPYASYKQYQTAYIAALNTYNAMLIQANAPGASPEVVQTFARNGAAQKQLVISAYGDWTADGYKDYVEEAIGIISNLAGQGPQALYQSMKANFTADRLTDTLGQQFYPTYVYPSDPMNPALASSWLKYYFNLIDISTFQSDSSTNSGGGASASWGLWHGSASVQYGSGQSNYSCDTTGLDVSAELLQIPLTRAWIRPEVFWSRGWNWSPQSGFGPVSDGNTPPGGLMPLYPTAVILAKNLAVKLDMSNQKNSSAWSSISTQASFGWGPFSISGNYSHSQSSSQKSYTQSSSGISVPGPQIIAFICETIPKSPNPDPSLNWPK
ncbi:MAG TPA: hypothetical protein VKE96_05480 [Vicinamibacterales bacterium]|nr:hypothetical protein [Vicinamibacterales bacterium]